MPLPAPIPKQMFDKCFTSGLGRKARPEFKEACRKAGAKFKCNYSTITDKFYIYIDTPKFSLRYAYHQGPFLANDVRKAELNYIGNIEEAEEALMRFILMVS